MAGILLLGLIARNSGVNWSPLLMLIGMTRYGQPGLFEHDGDLLAVARGPEIEVDQALLRRCES